jgi:hypothetical protein
MNIYKIIYLINCFKKDSFHQLGLNQVIQVAYFNID